MFGQIGLGTFPFAGPFSTLDEDAVHGILDAYFEAGGSYLDTAPTYGFGAVESLLGDYLKARERASFVVSTSCGYVRDGDGFRVSGRRADVLADAEESLGRLGLDHFDVYISHIPDPETPLTETAAALQELLDDGRAKQIGVSNVDAAQLRQYASAGNISVVQNRFSFLNRTVDPDLGAALDDAGARVVAYQVIERGLLTSRGPRITRDDDLRTKKPEFESERLQWVRGLVEGPLRRIADENEISVEELIIRWTVSQGRIGLAQVGATSAVEAARLPRFGEPLSPSVVESVEAVYALAAADLGDSGRGTVRVFLGLEDYDVRSGSASGK